MVGERRCANINYARINVALFVFLRVIGRLIQEELFSKDKDIILFSRLKAPDDVEQGA